LPNNFINHNLLSVFMVEFKSGSFYKRAHEKGQQKTK
jgi:hypothetical protein